MKKSIIAGILFTIILGTLLHFTYEWSGKNNIIALFSAVNESTWEHLKLLFFPYMIYMVYEYFTIGNRYSNYITAKTLGILSGLVAIPLIFNVYTAILGTNYVVLDILTFIVGVIISYIVSYIVLKEGELEFNKLSLIILILLTFAFFYFTFNPPHLDIFLDPVTKTYGIS